MKTGLVLGGGGLVGMGYHAGVLKALHESGFDLRSADVVVGTSAGSIIASYLASGWALTDFYEYAHGRHAQALAHPEEEDESTPLFDPMWRSRIDRARRGIGSFFALASSRGLIPLGGNGRVPPQILRKAFPAGMYSTERTLTRLREDLPAAWPRTGLYICTADLYSGRRVAFGHPDAPEAPLPDAVTASTAIPGFFTPVRIGDRSYVDGGVVSATSLDLAADDGCDAILCIAPLGYRAEAAPALDPKLWPAMATRRFFARMLAREVREARAKGVDVLVIRPWITDLGKLGTNAMKRFDRPAVVEVGRRGTHRFLEANADHPVVAAFTARRRERAG